MTQFWPKRSAPEGFSIEKLAKNPKTHSEPWKNIREIWDDLNFQ